MSPLVEGEAKVFVKAIYEARMLLDVIQKKSKSTALDPFIFEQITLKNI
tara:strand:+ start:152 stop:298 length:147 start_codon:yes stop_codon:yes gene_type:complete